MIPVEAPPLSEDRDTFLKDFMKVSEYGRSDILSYSTATGDLLTRNGGRYRMEGRKLIHIKGPSPDPSERI